MRYIPQYNPFSNEIEYIPTYDDMPQQQQQAGGGGPIGAAGTVAGALAAKYGAAKLGGALGFGSAAAAPVATTVGAAAAPSMSLGALAPMMPGGGAALGASSAAAGTGAATAGATGAAGAGSAGAGLGMLGTTAALAAPIVLGSLANKYLFADKPKRVFNADEIAVDKEGEFNKLNTQVQGYENLSTDGRKKLLTALADNRLLALPGYANEQGETQKRGAEFINWARLLRDPRQGGGADDGGANDRNSRWYSNVDQQPTEEDINKAYWLKDSAKQRLLNALSAVQTAQGEALA
jgi:hypothetical protein